MRKIEYLSPTSFQLWKKSKDDFYLRYLCDNRPPREPQNEPMALGAAVDAFIKNYLFEGLFGKGSLGFEKFELESIFISQVEEHNRDSIYEHAKYVFEQYKSSGALADLMSEINKGSGARMEFDLFGVVSGIREGQFSKIERLPLLGKPDLSFVTEDGIHIILDFKVNGYFSNYNTSPMAGYVRLRGAGGTNYGSHKNAFLGRVGNITINIGDTLDKVKKDWAEQLSIYSWLTGSPVGDDSFIVGIDQIIGNKGSGILPSIKVAEHRLKINSNFQKKLFEELLECFQTVTSEHIFRDISLEDSKSRCLQLESIYVQGQTEDQFLKDLLR